MRNNMQEESEDEQYVIKFINIKSRDHLQPYKNLSGVKIRRLLIYQTHEKCI